MRYSYQEPTRTCNEDNAVTALFGHTRAPDEFIGDRSGDRFTKTSRLLENPILESFKQNHIVPVNLPGMGPRKDQSMTVEVNRKLAHLFLAAFEKIKAENLPYVLHEVGGYLFRYQLNDTVKAAITHRPEYAELRKRDDFSKRWNILCAEQDRALKAFDEKIPYRTGIRAKKDLLSNHAWGSAIDINWDTNPYKRGERFDMPRRIVEILEGLGFHWGGYYHDYMHFEYARSTIVGVPDEEPPQVFFPFATEQKRESPLKYYFLNERGSGGYFPLGLQQNLHGGVHLEPEPSSTLVPVQAAMPGYIVAARLMAPNTGGDNPDVRYVSEGRHLGFVLIRHELVQKPDNEPEKVHPLYSLYMHLAPPDWGRESQDFEKVPWLASLLKMRFGGLVNLDPNSHDVGKTFWAREPVTPEATSVKVHGLASPLSARSGERILALAKPSPDDVSEAIQALEAGAVVTFDRALFPVAAGETIGFVTEGLPFTEAFDTSRPSARPRLPKYLHWELFSLGGEEGGIQVLRKKAGELNDLLKPVKEARENNFLEMPSPRKQDSPNEIQQLLGEAGGKIVESLKTDGYGRVVLKHFNDGKTFFSAEGNAAVPFTYPIELEFENKHQYKGESGGKCVLEVTYSKAGAPLPRAPERIELSPNQGKLTLNVPAEADEIALWSPHFFLDKPTPTEGENPRPKRLESRAELFKKAASHRWRNLVLDHMNEWTPKGLDVQLDARGEAGHLDELVDTSDPEAFAKWKKQLRPLSWWSRKKSEDDLFGEVPVLGAEAEERSLFGSGDHLLPEDANLVNMHPVTALWLVDLLLEKEAIAFRKSWPPSTLKRGASTQQPPFLGLLWKDQAPRVGIEMLAVLVQHGYGTTDGANATDVSFWGTTKGGEGAVQASQLLFRVPYVEGVALGRLRFPFWGRWEMHATDGNEQRFEPVKTGATQLELLKPKPLGQTFELGANATPGDPAGKLRPLVTGTLICRENCPFTLAGYIVFEHWRASKGGQPNLEEAPTPSKLAIPVLAGTPIEDRVEGGLKYSQDFIVGRVKEKSNPKVTADFSFQNFVSHPRLGPVFAGNAKTGFKLAVPLAQRLQKLRDACRPKSRKEKDIPLTVKLLGLDGLSLLVIPTPGSGADLSKVEEKLALLPDNELFSAERLEEESAIEITYNPNPSTGSLAFAFDPGPALGLIAADALSAEGETLHVRSRFLAPNGGHLLLTGKDSPVGDATKLISVSVEDIKAACGNDFIEVVADKLLPPVSRFEFGDFEIKMGRGKVHTEVRLHGDINKWKAASPFIQLDGAGTPKGKIVGQSLTADWDLFKDEKGTALTGRWGGVLKFSTELAQPDKVATPPPPVSREVELKPSLDELTREIGAKALKFVGKATALPTDVALRIVCERADDAGQWQEDVKITELIRYTVPTKGNAHFGHCKETGAFEATLPKATLKKTPGTYRFTWLPKGQRAGTTVDVHGLPVEVKSAPEVKPEDLGP